MTVNQKSQQISLALLKLAIYVRRRELRQRIENLAFQLIEDTASGSLEEALTIIDVLRALVSFGKSIYEIEPINAKIVLNELDTLALAVRGSTVVSGDIADIFFKLPVVVNDAAPKEGESRFAEAKARLEEEEHKHIAESGNSNGNGANGITATIRQSAIIEKIRQSGNTAMKDMIAAFPDVSERTLRYDLQRLCNQGVIERMGNGGPTSYYILRNKIAQGSL